MTVQVQYLSIDNSYIVILSMIVVITQVLSDCISDYKTQLIHLRLFLLCIFLKYLTYYSLSKTSSTLPTILILISMFHSLLAILDLVVSS